MSLDAKTTTLLLLLDESAVLQTWSLDREAAYRQLSVKEPAHTFAILQTPSGLTL